jgi:hypothetical protein
MLLGMNHAKKYDFKYLTFLLLWKNKYVVEKFTYTFYIWPVEIQAVANHFNIVVHWVCWR